MNFAWKNLPKPFLALAPMEDVTDTVFRQIVASVHKPDVMFTEFVSVEGLCSVGKETLLKKLAFTPGERPLIAQIWGVTPKYFFDVAKELVGMGFDGIDINMGCPQRNIMKNGGGAALIDTPEIARGIIQAARDGIHATGKSIPLSVKTRVGNKIIVTDTWIQFLLEQHLDALTVHGRIAKDMSEKPADWKEIQKAVQLRDSLNIETIIIGNGDVLSYDQARQYGQQYGVDGVMIGRGIFHNINVFDPSGSLYSPKQLMQTLAAHIDLFEKTYGPNTHRYSTLKKYFKIYIRDFEGSVELRKQLMETRTASDAKEVIKTYIK